MFVYSFGYISLALSDQSLLSLISLYPPSTGTDANVSITLFGTLSDSGSLALAKSETFSDPFERGNTDVFTRKLHDLGKLTRIRIGHDSKGRFSSWKLARVEVVEEDSQSRFVFQCNAWLSKSKGDKQTVREFACTSGQLKAVTGTYKLELYTNASEDSACMHAVDLTLVGADDEHMQVHLVPESGVFASGSVETCVFSNVLLVKQLHTLKVRIARPLKEAAGTGRGQRGRRNDSDDEDEAEHTEGWKLDKVVVKNLEEDTTVIFSGSPRPIWRTAELRIDDSSTILAADAALQRTNVVEYEVRLCIYTLYLC